MSEQYYYNKRIKNAPIRRRLDRRFVSWVLVAACIGTVIASGFVFSAKCHFEAVALGYQTQQQRAMLDEQSERRRQLELERARALAPDELEQRARRVGLRNPEPAEPPTSETATADGRAVDSPLTTETASARRTAGPEPSHADTVRVSEPAPDTTPAVAKSAAQPATSDSTTLRKATQY